MVKRKCVGCGAIKDRNELIRITKNFISGKIEINRSSGVFGRSAYICYNKKCIEEALKKNRLNKALKSKEDLKGNIKWTEILE